MYGGYKSKDEVLLALAEQLGTFTPLVSAAKQN
jgi:hypothetical protein